MDLKFYIFYCILVIYIKAEECHMPNGKLGKCMSPYLCPGFLRASTNPFPGTEDYLQKFNCGTYDSVCCGPPLDETFDKRELSDTNYCGYQHSDDFPSSNASQASLYEFPWLAAIMALEVKTNRLDVLCQGVLISDRYVITLAGISNFQPEKINITGVRLGEFNIKTKTDCVHHQRYNLEECSTAEDYGIEKIISHPLYKKYYDVNNIALVKLNRTVSYSDYIRPICLPIVETAYAKPGDALYITGWGYRTSRYEDKNLSDVRKKVASRLIDSDECRRMVPQDIQIKITSYVTCTLDLPNNTYFTCDGDAGAPVMFSYRNQWYVEGIVTAIINRSCGTKYPIVSLRISRYLDWIKQNML